jgi:TRAP-type C4-dicarboxylate transport system substrate-binding protein
MCFACRDHGVVHANRAVNAIEDIRRLRLHVPNRLAAEAIRALGAQGVAAPTPQVPMAIAGHVIDGCVDPWDALPAMKLLDALKYHTDFAESGLSTATFVLAMNKQVYERLPRDLKTVIDSNAGQAAAGMAGAMWDLEAKTVAGIVRDRGDAITMLTADDVGRWRKTTEPVIVAWQKQMKERKLDGGKLIASVQALLAKYAGEPEPQQSPPPQPSEQKVPSKRPLAKASSAKTSPLWSRMISALCS